MPYAKLDASDARITRRTEFESKNHETWSIIITWGRDLSLILKITLS